VSDALHRLREWGAETAIILGSGLSSIVPETGEGDLIPYTNFQEIPKTSVPGHAGRFVLAKMGNVKVIFAQGRVHLYEGFSGKEVTAGVRILAQAGIRQLVLTNAAGSANPQFAPGTWMMITDHLNLTGTSPLVGAPEFIDLTSAYSARLRDRFVSAAGRIGMVLHQGVYAGLLGPQYETPAEVRMLQTLGAQAVGMSTVLEAIQARALGLEVAGFSCLTNFAAGISPTKLSHAEVLETGKAAAAQFGKLLGAALPEL
jgi:purine-nucleoside phosphorylase